MELDKYTDQEIVQAMLRRDASVTREYLYIKCYPLFKSIFYMYYTDCENPIELINEIYVYILIPHEKTHRSKLQDFAFRSPLVRWLEIVTKNYCHQIFAKRLPIDSNIDVEDDSFERITNSVEIEIKKLFMEDGMEIVQRILGRMPNARYRRLIELRYLQNKTNEETAAALNLKIDSYYPKHKLAKAQLYTAMKEEGVL